MRDVLKKSVFKIVCHMLTLLNICLTHFSIFLQISQNLKYRLYFTFSGLLCHEDDITDVLKEHYDPAKWWLFTHETRYGHCKSLVSIITNRNKNIKYMLLRVRDMNHRFVVSYKSYQLTTYMLNENMTLNTFFS